jgi:hypothetical protein
LLLNLIFCSAFVLQHQHKHHTIMRVLAVVALAAFALASSSASLDHNARKAERDAKRAVDEGAAAADGVFASASRAAGDAANVSASLLPPRLNSSR